MLYFNLNYVQAHNALESFGNLNILDCKIQGLTLNRWTGEYYLYTPSNQEGLKTRIGDFNGIIDCINEIIFIANVMLGRITQDEEKMTHYYNSACHHPTAKLNHLFPTEEPDLSFAEEEAGVPPLIDTSQIDEMHTMMRQMTEALQRSEAKLGTDDVVRIFSNLLQMTQQNSERLDQIAAAQQVRTALLSQTTRFSTPARQPVPQTPIGKGGSAFSSARAPKPTGTGNAIFG